MIEYYTYFPVLDYLPLSDTEKKIMALVLTFAKKNGLHTSNQKIGEVIHRSPATVRNAITAMNKKGLIAIVAKQSVHRKILPGQCPDLGGTVEPGPLSRFCALVSRPERDSTVPPGRDTEYTLKNIKSRKRQGEPDGPAAGEPKRTKERQAQIDELRRREQTMDTSKSIGELYGKFRPPTPKNNQVDPP